MEVHIGYVIAFVAVSVGASFALGWFVRKAQGPREDDAPPANGSWERATRTSIDFGPASIGRANSGDVWRWSADAISRRGISGWSVVRCTDDPLQDGVVLVLRHDDPVHDVSIVFGRGISRKMVDDLVVRQIELANRSLGLRRRIMAEEKSGVP
jgi:hypothetical protein